MVVLIVVVVVISGGHNLVVGSSGAVRALSPLDVPNRASMSI